MAIITIMTILSPPRYIDITKRLTISIIMLFSITILRYYCPSWRLTTHYLGRRQGQAKVMRRHSFAHCLLLLESWMCGAACSTSREENWRSKTHMESCGGRVTAWARGGSHREGWVMTHPHTMYMSAILHASTFTIQNTMTSKQTKISISVCLLVLRLFSFFFMLMTVLL